MEVAGTILATKMGVDWPTFDSELRFIRISGVRGFRLAGGGVVDGQGADWWAMARAHPHTPSLSKARPPLVGITSVVGLRVENITLQNSPRFHLPIGGCSDVAIEGVTIDSPRDARASEIDLHLIERFRSHPLSFPVYMRMNCTTVCVDMFS